MSHLKERKEKKFLKWNAVICGRFCHVCGQGKSYMKKYFFTCKIDLELL